MKKIYKVTVTPYENKDFNEAQHGDAQSVIVRCGESTVKRYVNALARRYKRQVETYRDAASMPFKVQIHRDGPLDLVVRRNEKNDEGEHLMEFRVEAVEVEVRQFDWVEERIAALEADATGNGPFSL